VEEHRIEQCADETLNRSKKVVAGFQLPEIKKREIPKQTLSNLL
jgi:hypothetical protein